MDVLTWALLVGGTFVAVVAALNLLGLARGRLRSESLGRAQSLAFAMMGAGLAGFLWPPFPSGDAPPALWRFFWMGAFGAGLALLVGPGIWRVYKRRARSEGDALFFLRVYTDPHDWRPMHFVLLGALAASVFLFSLIPNNWWQLVAGIAFIVLLESLRILPVHGGRRPHPPSALGSASRP